jgi:hypothetical protein
MPLTPFYKRILEAVPHLPDEAIIPVPAAAMLEGKSERSIKDTYPLIQISEKRQGVLLGYLRSRRKDMAQIEKPAA